MSRIAHSVILDFGFFRRRRTRLWWGILDLKPQIQKLNSGIVSRFTPHALLFLTCALQIPAFAADNSNCLIPPSSSVNLKYKIANQKSELPSAMEILAQVRAHFPREMLFIKGQILSGGRLGKLERACYIEMFLELGEDPATVRYKTSDAFGTPVEQMTISMAEGCETEFEYESGNPLRPSATPPLNGVIRGTDVTWNDLSLLFLWRADGRTVREENLRGRDCHVIEFPGNAVRQNQGGGTILIWIDMQMLMLIQMEDIGPDGKLLRRLSVKNIKKISEQWMIKNMEIRTYPSLHHTLVRIDEVVHGP